MRKTIIILSCCIIVLLLGYSGYRGYEVWKQNHWMSLAKAFAAKSDTHNEFLCLEQVLRYNPRDLEACRMMADLAEAAHSPSTVIWRKRVLELNPASTDDRLALAQAAVIFNDYATATNALAGVDAAGRKTAGYFNVAGELAIVGSKLDEAEADFEEAARLQPSNPAPRLNLAIIQLHRTNALDMAEARITLKRMVMNSTNAVLRAQAERELVMDALRFKDNKTALLFSAKLTQPTNAVFTDKLLRLNVLLAANSDEYKSAFASCEREAASNPDKFYKLTLWMMARNMASEALAWMQTLPATVRTNQPAALLAAQCQMMQRDWSGLRDSISNENWGKLEFTRHAYIARALREQGLSGASKAEWQVALTAANNQVDNLTALFRMAAQWNWSDEAQQILWTIVNAFPQAQWASQYLTAALYADGATRPLMQLFSLQVNRNPSDLDAKNNLALTAMLLNAREMNPYELAHEVYQKDPTNPPYVSTYAFSLHLQGKDAEALKIMQQLTPKDLDDPSTAGYYGLILKATGDTAKAKTYLKISIKGRVLPEERTMFERALIDI